MFGEGTGRIVLDEVVCSGLESRLVECPALPIGVSDCQHFEDVGVQCGVPGIELYSRFDSHYAKKALC